MTTGRINQVVFPHQSMNSLHAHVRKESQITECPHMLSACSKCTSQIFDMRTQIRIHTTHLHIQCWVSPICVASLTNIYFTSDRNTVMCNYIAMYVQSLTHLDPTDVGRCNCFDGGLHIPHC